LPRQLSSPLAGGDDGLQHHPRRAGRLGPLQNQTGVADYGGQQIVEVVRDASGQNSQALQLLGLTESLFILLALRHVRTHYENSRKRAGIIGHWGAGNVQPDTASVLLAEVVFVGFEGQDLV
jgi:hypothetical protein